MQFFQATRLRGIRLARNQIIAEKYCAVSAASRHNSLFQPEKDWAGSPDSLEDCSYREVNIMDVLMSETSPVFLALGSLFTLLPLPSQTGH